MATKMLKKFTLQKKDIKADGSFKCVFATMGVIDKDGDVSMPGFFGEQSCVVVPSHDWSVAPMGKARIYEDGDKAIAEGKFNLDICDAKDWFSAMQFDLENGEPLMEWSYGFTTLPGGGTMGQMEGKSVRFLGPIDGQPGCKIFEVSPVLVGAGEKTRTLMAKALGDDGKKLCDEAAEVLDAAEVLITRAGSLADLRKKDGRELSAVNKERLALIADAFATAAKGMLVLVAPAVKAEVKSSTSPELVKELGRALKLRAGIQA